MNLVNMAVRSCCRLFAPRVRLSNSEVYPRKLYTVFFRILLRPSDSNSLSRPSSYSLVPREGYSSTRGLHAATCTNKDRKDVVMDEDNPFYEKYSEKLDKLKGCVSSCMNLFSSLSLLLPFPDRFNQHQTRAKIKAARLQEKSRETAFVPPSRPSPHSQYSLLQPPVRGCKYILRLCSILLHCLCSCSILLHCLCSILYLSTFQLPLSLSVFHSVSHNHSLWTQSCALT